MQVILCGVVTVVIVLPIAAAISLWRGTGLSTWWHSEAALRLQERFRTQMHALRGQDDASKQWWLARLDGYTLAYATHSGVPWEYDPSSAAPSLVAEFLRSLCRADGGSSCSGSITVTGHPRSATEVRAAVAMASSVIDDAVEDILDGVPNVEDTASLDQELGRTKRWLDGMIAQGSLTQKEACIAAQRAQARYLEQGLTSQGNGGYPPSALNTLVDDRVLVRLLYEPDPTLGDLGRPIYRFRQVIADLRDRADRFQPPELKVHARMLYLQELVEHFCG